MNQNITLIGGAPLTGKSTLAKKLSNKLNNNINDNVDKGINKDLDINQTTIISTDTIRNKMKKNCLIEDYPRLFYSSGLTCSEFYQKFNNNALEIMKAEIQQGYDVEEGIKEKLITNYQDLIIEGIAITPSFIINLKNSYDFKHYNFNPIFLYDNNKERIWNRISSRGLWDSADKYPDEVKPIELEWVILYNKWYYRQAKKFKFKITHI